MTRKTVPPGSVVPIFLVEASESPELLTGIVSVVHTTQAEAPGRFETMFFDTSSILTTARPLPSCPVTTRRTLMVMTSPCWVEPIIRGRVSSNFVSAAREKIHEHRYTRGDPRGRDARRRDSRDREEARRGRAPRDPGAVRSGRRRERSRQGIRSGGRENRRG